MPIVFRWFDRTAQLLISHVIHISDAEIIIQDSTFKMWRDDFPLNTLDSFSISASVCPAPASTSPGEEALYKISFTW